MRESYRKLVGLPSTNDGRAVFSLFILFAFLLFFAVFTAGELMKSNVRDGRLPEREIAEHVNAFYLTPPETATLPESTLVLGTGELTISVFTDFLCGACYRFYQVEKDLFARYRGRIRVAYYHYPLDRACNPNVGTGRYPGSCAAARAMIATSEMGIFREYFSLTSETSSASTRLLPDTAIATAAGLADIERFTATMGSQKTGERLARALRSHGGRHTRDAPIFIGAGGSRECLPRRSCSA